MKETSAVELIQLRLREPVFRGGAVKGSRYLHSTLPPFVSVTKSTLLRNTLPPGWRDEGLIDARVVLPGHPVYREGVFVLLPGCRHWLRTCSAFLKSCHPCYGIDSPPTFPSPLHLAIKPGSFPRRRNHHKKDRRRSAPLRPPPRDRKKFLTPVVVSTICI